MLDVRSVALMTSQVPLQLQLQVTGIHWELEQQGIASNSSSMFFF
jgi:hypothetical protein